MLEILSPLTINASPYRARLANAGIKGGWNYALDHAWLFEKIDHYLRSRSHAGATVFDVGCGNSMFHPFLEQELNIGIIGVDRIDGQCSHPGRTPIMDFCMDFLDMSARFESVADIVFWLSSIEHNDPDMQRACVEASLRLLKPGGLFLATFGFSPQTHYYGPSEQTNLSAADAVRVFSTEWTAPPDFSATVNEYRLDLMDLDSRHYKRYGTRDYEFIVAAASRVKGDSIL